MNRSRFILFVAAIVCRMFSSASRAAEVVIELPPETGTYRKVAGVELAQSFCVQCHSVDYTAMQPPMPAKFWQGVVQKMREKYSAPWPAELDAKLAAYLARAYGSERASK